MQIRNARHHQSYPHFFVGVEIAGSEYTYAGGAGIFAMYPRVAPGATFRESIPLGTVLDAPRALRRALEALRSDFGPDDYSLVKLNCNHFSAALVMELLGKPIPAYVNRLAFFGSFFSCFLPVEMTSQAPVSQEGNSTGAAEPSVQRFIGTSSGTRTAFSGEGVRSGSKASGVPADKSEYERRERIRQATMTRLAGATEAQGASSA